MKSSRIGFALCASMVLVAGLVAGGCATTAADRNRANLTPELEGMASTHQQRLNDNARAINTDFRQINDDWDAIWFLDEPLHLSKYPIP